MIKSLVAETDVLQGRFLLRRAGVRQRVLLWPQGAPHWEKVSDDDFMLDLSKNPMLYNSLDQVSIVKRAKFIVCNLPSAPLIRQSTWIQPNSLSGRWTGPLYKSGSLCRFTSYLLCSFLAISYIFLNYLLRIDDSRCNKPCPGGAWAGATSELCGGDWALDVYFTGVRQANMQQLDSKQPNGCFYSLWILEPFLLSFIWIHRSYAVEYKHYHNV